MQPHLTGVHEKAADVLPETPAYGLRRDALAPLEVLAQSISTIAPSTSPNLTIPLVFALAGNGTWLAYVIAMAAMLLVSLPIAIFARSSASPGSLYTYTRETLPPAFAALGALALFFAYIMTASSVIGGFINSCSLFLPSVSSHALSSLIAVGLAVAAAAGAFLIAFRDVQISARLMLWVEMISVALIALVVALTLLQHGVYLDREQLHLHGVTSSGVRLGVMLAIFSFVGFESATTLGAEARDPLRSIPRAVTLSALLSGLFFVLSAYTETLGFRTSKISLDASTAPMVFLSDRAGIAWAGLLINIGVLVSMFAATLACIIAAARVLLLMSHHGLVHARLQATHARTESPALAGGVAAILAVLPAAVLLGRGVSGADVYGWMGTLAVFGFLTAYALVAITVLFHLKRNGRLTVGGIVLSCAATLAMLGGIFGTLYPIPPAPYRYLPFIYAGYLAIGGAWYALARLRTAEEKSIS